MDPNEYDTVLAGISTLTAELNKYWEIVHEEECRGWYKEGHCTENTNCSWPRPPVLDMKGRGDD